LDLEELTQVAITYRHSENSVVILQILYRRELFSKQTINKGEASKNRVKAIIITVEITKDSYVSIRDTLILWKTNGLTKGKQSE